MSRRPGRGVGPGAMATGSGFRGSRSRPSASGIGPRRHWQRERLVGDRYEAVDFDQVDGTPGMLERGKEGAVQPQRRENTENPAAADARRRFRGQESAVRTGLLLHPAPDRERIGTVAAGVAASAER